MEFNTVRLGEIADILGGYAFKSADFLTKGIPVVKIKNITPPMVNLQDSQFVSEEVYREKIKYALTDGDILISMTGSNFNQIDSAVGKVGRFHGNQKALLNQRVGKIFVTQPNIYDEDFLYYVLSQKEIQYELASSASGSANQANINPNLIKQLQVPIPSLNEQKKIKDFLLKISGKINLNKELIQNLEIISQTLFKQWFIDFEFPNEEGEPYKSSGGEMVESVMGKIPINWSISKIETIAQFKNGKKITSDDRNETGIYKIFGSNGVIGYTNKTLYSAPSLVIGRVGANCGSMELSLDPCWISDNAIMCAPKNMIYYNFLYILLKKIKLKERAGGSAQPLINQSILKGLKFILPSESLVKKFHSIAYKNTQLTENLKKENEKLAEIRDTLLPKLLSGEIEIPDNFEV